MDTKKVVLLEQIQKDFKAGSTSTIVEVFSKLTDKQIAECFNQESKDYLESIRVDFEFKKGMKVRAKKDLKGKDTNWNSPSRVDIPKGTIFELESAENNGDLFAVLLEGTCVCQRRDGDPYELTPSKYANYKEHVILVEGKTSRHPFDFGLALKSAWEVIS